MEHKYMSITYTVTIEEEISFDLDKVIEAILTTLREDSNEINLINIDNEWCANIEYYLYKLGIIDDSVELSDDTLDEVYEGVMKRLSEIYPKIS